MNKIAKICSHRKANVITIFIILALGLALRIFFFVGPSRVDPFWYIRASGEIMKGTYAPTLSNMKWFRYAMILPTSLGISLGSHDWSVVAYPFLCSLASILLIYLIGKRLWDTFSGLAAAAILASLSWLDLTLATQLLPGAVVVFFTLLSIYMALTEKSKDPWILFVSGLSLGVTYSIRFVTPALILPTIMGIGIWRRWQKRQWLFLLLGIVVVPFVESFYFLLVVGNPFHRFNMLRSLQSKIGLDGWVSKPTEFLALMFWDETSSIFFYGFLMSVVLLLFLQDWLVLLPVGWWTSTYFLLESGYTFSRVAEKDTRMLIHLVAPAVIVMGRVLGRQMQNSKLGSLWLRGVMLVGSAVSLGVSIMKIELSWKFQLVILLFLMMILIIVSSGKQNHWAISTSLVLFFLLLSAQGGVQARAYQEKFNNSHQPYKQASAYLSSLEADEILTNSDHFANVFHFYHGLDSGYIISKETLSAFRWRSISSNADPLNSSTIYLVNLGDLHIPTSFLKLEKLVKFNTNRGEMVIYRLSVPRSPKTAEAYGRLAWLYSMVGEVNQAREHIAIAQRLCRISECPKITGMYLQSLLAQVEYQTGNGDSTIAIMDDLISRLAEVAPKEREILESTLPFSIYKNYYQQSLLIGDLPGSEETNEDFEEGLATWRLPDKQKYNVNFSATKECAYRGEFGGQIQGLDSAYHNGISVSMSELGPGTYIVVGAMVRAHNSFGFNPTEFEVEVNYVQGHDNKGKPIGMHGEKTKGSFPWTPVVRIVKIPENAEKNFGYYPVLLTGKGTVCVDNVFWRRLGSSR
jgi:hypothetical protein